MQVVLKDIIERLGTANADPVAFERQHWIAEAFLLLQSTGFLEMSFADALAVRQVADQTFGELLEYRAAQTRDPAYNSLSDPNPSDEAFEHFFQNVLEVQAGLKLRDLFRGVSREEKQAFWRRMYDKRLSERELI